MRLLLNILWFIFGGFVSGMLWLFGGLVLAVTIVGLPYAMAAWRIAGLALWPFGQEIVPRAVVPRALDPGPGPPGCLPHVTRLLFAGWYIALSHIVAAFLEAITIIGLPFAFKDLQLAAIAMAPIGKIVVEKR